MVCIQRVRWPITVPPKQEVRIPVPFLEREICVLEIFLLLKEITSRQDFRVFFS